jgi:hypothetical protein
MWFGMWWWVIPLVVFLALRGGCRRRYRRMQWRGEREDGTDFRDVVERQRSYIEELEARLSRVEEGLEFAERLLAERGLSAGTAR